MGGALQLAGHEGARGILHLLLRLLIASERADRVRRRGEDLGPQHTLGTVRMWAVYGARVAAREGGGGASILETEAPRVCHGRVLSGAAEAPQWVMALELAGHEGVGGFSQKGVQTGSPKGSHSCFSSVFSKPSGRAV